MIAPCGLPVTGGPQAGPGLGCVALPEHSHMPPSSCRRPENAREKWPGTVSAAGRTAAMVSVPAGPAIETSNARSSASMPAARATHQPLIACTALHAYRQGACLSCPPTGMCMCWLVTPCQGGQALQAHPHDSLSDQGQLLTPETETCQTRPAQQERACQAARPATLQLCWQAARTCRSCSTAENGGLSSGSCCQQREISERSRLLAAPGMAGLRFRTPQAYTICGSAALSGAPGATSLTARPAWCAPAWGWTCPPTAALHSASRTAACQTQTPARTGPWSLADGGRSLQQHWGRTSAFSVTLCPSNCSGACTHALVGGPAGCTCTCIPPAHHVLRSPCQPFGGGTGAVLEPAHASSAPAYAGLHATPAGQPVRHARASTGGRLPGQAKVCHLAAQPASIVLVQQHVLGLQVPDRPDAHEHLHRSCKTQQLSAAADLWMTDWCR